MVVAMLSMVMRVGPGNPGYGARLWAVGGGDTIGVGHTWGMVAPGRAQSGGGGVVVVVVGSRLGWAGLGGRAGRWVVTGGAGQRGTVGAPRSSFQVVV